MLEKYIEERFNRYMVFGEHVDDIELVDVADSVQDMVQGVTRDDAARIIKDRDTTIDMLVRLAQKLDEVDEASFREIWYNE